MIFTVAKPIPIGSYRADLKSAEIATHPEYGEGVCFRFAICSGANAGQEPCVTCSTERPPSPKNKLGRILSGMLGRPVQPGEAIDATQFVGKRFNIVLQSNQDGTGTCISAVMPDQEAF